MKPIACKVLIVGGGPGGYVAAIRAGQLGLDTVLVESQKLGGTCLNIGCIPSKALIHAADEFERARAFAAGDAPGISVRDPKVDFATTAAWKDGIVGRLNDGVAGLLRGAGVKVVPGWARMRDGKTCAVAGDTGEQIVTAEHVVIATGSLPVELPALPFGEKVISSTGALGLTELPASLAVVGAGYIGLELGMAFAKLGARVAVIEAEGRILPQYDPELTRPVARRLQDLGIDVWLNARAEGLSAEGTALRVSLAEDSEMQVPADKVLVTVGRRPRTEGWGLEELDLATDGRFLRIDDGCRTSMRNVWAVGDVTGEPMLAHRAMAQGEMVAELIAGHARAFDKVCIPAICFTDPEIVTAGLSPAEARDAGHPTKVGLFPFAANGRAMTMAATDGFVRVVARADDHLVLGIQAVGKGVSELAAGFALALEMGARLEDIAATVHAHPSLGEAFHEASLKALGHALHI